MADFKKSKAIKYVIVLFAAAVVGLVLEFVCHFSAFRAGSDAGQERLISMEGVELAGFEVSEEPGGDIGNYRLTLQGDTGYVHIPMDGSFVGEFAYDVDYEGAWNAYVKLGYSNIYGETTDRDSLLVDDRNPAYLKSSVIPVNKKVTYVDIAVSREHLAELMPPDTDVSGSVAIGNFRVLPARGFNAYRFAFFFFAALIIGALVCFRDLIGLKPELGFLLIALTFGTLITVSLPANKIGYDEETHFAQSLWLANYRTPLNTTDVVIDQTMTGIATWPYNQPGSLTEQQLWNSYLDEKGLLKGGDRQWSDNLNKRTMTGYAGEALFIKLGQILGLPFSLVFRLGRLGNLLIYTIAMFFAIKITPVGKGIFMFLGLCPEPVLLASVYSYDPTVNAFIYLAMAMLLKQILSDKIGIKEFAAAAIAFSFGCAIKAVYAPLILVGLLIPKERFKDEKTAKLIKLGFVAVFVAWILSFVLPVVFAPRDIGDLRGGATSEKGQMAYILGAPLSYACVLIKNIWATFPNYVFGTDSLVRMGEKRFFSYPWMVMMGAAAVILCDRGFAGAKGMFGEKIKLFGKLEISRACFVKIWLFLFSGAAAVLVFTSMYIAFTPPGQTFIEGVQGRYYLPFLPCVWLAMNMDGVFALKITRERWNVLVLGMMGVILGSCVWTDVLGVFCR